LNFLLYSFLYFGSRSLNCLSFYAELSLSRTFVQDYIDSLRCEKAIRLLHFVLSALL